MEHFVRGKNTMSTISGFNDQGMKSGVDWDIHFAEVLVEQQK